MSVVLLELTEEERDAVVVRLMCWINEEKKATGRVPLEAKEALRKLEEAEPHRREVVR